MFDVQPYWLVHGAGPTNYRHETREAADREAERLARAYPGQVFVVLESVEAFRKIDVHRVSLRGRGPAASPHLGDDIPF